MNLGKSLFTARKKCGLTQEEVAEKLFVSRQTISKWETDETVPDIHQAKTLANLYNLTLDELIEFDIDTQEIEKIINSIDEKTQNKIDWTSLWGKKYPVLTAYQKQVDVSEYVYNIIKMTNKLKSDYNYTNLEAFLVLKDILSKVYKNSN